MSIAYTNAKIILKNTFNISFTVSNVKFQKFLFKGSTICDDLSIRELKYIFARRNMC